MKFKLALFAFFLWLACVASYRLTQASRPAGSNTPDVVLAFGSKSCSICVQNKPELERLRSEKLHVVFFDNSGNLRFVPYYVLIRDGAVIVDTSSLDELKRAL